MIELVELQTNYGSIIVNPVTVSTLTLNETANDGSKRTNLYQVGEDAATFVLTGTPAENAVRLGRFTPLPEKG